MKQFYLAINVRRYVPLHILAAIFSLYGRTAIAQSCPPTVLTSITTYPNTYFPAGQANVASGSTSIVLSAASYGTTPIASGDVLLLIQMQGAQIKSSNNSNYGANTGTGSGYLNNGSLMAGNMEYVLASNSVPLTGGTLNLASGVVNSYKNAAFGTDGQYTYQIVRVPLYYNLQLSNTLSPPRWDGISGGVLVLYAVNNILLNSQSIDASGLGFRGGGGRAFNGAGSGSSSDYITTSVSNANGSKGEGIAGTPKYLNHNNSFLDVSGTEGYPNGSYGRGAPGNAGGGGTDGNPANNNDENTGGGGGANGGTGGNGGNAWSSATTSGGKPGSVFAQKSPSRLVMGGGGGAGTTNDGTGNPSNGFASSGAAGGGIIILVANSIVGPGNIKSNGITANSSVVNDGTGGGGAGGSILIYTSTGSLSNVTISAKGGNGGSNELTGGSSGPAHGPGGGGGGGIIYSNMSLSGTSSVAGGSAGTTSGGTNNYGATAGVAGLLSTTTTQTQLPSFPVSCVVLSAAFLDVSAQQENGEVAVKWVISEAANTQEYLVEKSLDFTNFTAIGHVPRKLSTTNGTDYEFPDSSPLTAGTVWYYRIKEVEASGQSIYSKVVSVRAGGLAGKFSVYPNPTKGTATVSFVLSAQSTISLRLFDLKGSTIWQQQYQGGAGQNTISLDNFRSVPDGMYILQWFDGLKPEQVKLVVTH